MSTPARITWAALISALAAGLTIATFVARSVAQAEVSPVKERVAKVEEQEKANKEALDDIKRGINKLIDMHLEPKR